MGFFGYNLNCNSINVHLDHHLVYEEDDVNDIVDKYETKIGELQEEIERLKEEIADLKA
ncbi:MAG: hypothetical protein MJZ34_06995 [Paludibacteraceae bacterium]|nr:hypothetical protein [Paludibacteraceae bacterium]